MPKYNQERALIQLESHPKYTDPCLLVLSPKSDSTPEYWNGHVTPNTKTRLKNPM